MDVPGISFLDAPVAAAADPNRMDIAMFVGFLPLRAGDEGLRARNVVAARLARQGWAARANDTLTDVPVRVTSIEEVEQLFDTGGRMDRHAIVRSRPLPDSVELPEGGLLFVVNLDGSDQRVELTAGSFTRVQLRDLLNAALGGIAVTIDPVLNGTAALVFRRLGATPGSLTVYTHTALGFPVAATAASQAVGAPMGVALRSFFTSGGREAVIVRMGDPVPLFARERGRVNALATLVGGEYGAGAASLADLLGTVLPQLPAEFPTRDPWHGLAHLHGLQDIALVLLPDLPDLVATVPALVPETETSPRPRETFAPCAPEPPATINGAIRQARPASVNAGGLELWSRIVVWAAEQVERITPEAMVVTALPLVDEDAEVLTAHEALGVVTSGNGGQGMAHRQLQIAAPWIASNEARDMPAGASPADGLLAGHIAASTLASGAWRTVAGRTLAPSQRPYAAPTMLGFDTSPQLSVIGYGVRGPTILSDRTTDPGSFNQANIRRLTGLILRAARHRGETAVFEANGNRFWRDVAMSITTLMRQLHSAGALRGLTEPEAFDVQCGPQTMSQADIDAGRAIAEVTFAPSHSLEFIEISLLAASGSIEQRRAGA
ncbi:hypothetical protein LY632_05405 [Erythrobacter sp. SDW2]|uniref:hypothetical protein n=1 Tax=Erythrobacter sp. SDW2 TaxID=2907154 RepID=UPI001F33EB46|nr:hypothetical protein [Erythrobacter sp. SDW2]UIP07837.1 hypothetical protein LY632_05405 [Erythrobacter sp. SDW2]